MTEVHVPRRRRKAVEAGGTLTVHASIEFTLVEGAMRQEDAIAWLESAVVEYHRMRGGWVGVDCRAGVTLPAVHQVEPTTP